MKTWREYAHRWQAGTDWPPIEDATVKPEDRRTYLQTLGDEWGDKTSVEQFARDFLLPSLSTEATVLDIGCGGGRIARHVAGRCRLLVCLDIELEMLVLCRRTVQHLGDVGLLLVPMQPPNIPLRNASIDFLYCFDVFVHLDQRTVYQYLIECARVLKPGARAVIHVASHETADGWNHFAESIKAGEAAGDFGSFEYIDSRAFLRMASMADFECEATSLTRSGNYYYDRDIVFVLRRR